ncbi:MAG TPA: glycosyltransferase family 9 protein, partial [Parafilimonas sp.]
MYKSWNKKKYPKRILAIRLQAMGDVVITLPYLQDLCNKLPADVEIDLLTRKEVDSIPRSLKLFNKIYSIGGKRNFKKQFISTCLLLPVLYLRRYDIVLDLQDNLLSKMARKSIMPKAWSVFEKFAPISAGEKNRIAVENIGLAKIDIAYNFVFKQDLFVEKILKENGWDEKSDLIIINPAGAFETRNWALEKYAAFMELFLQKFPQSQFLIIGVELIKSKADYFKKLFQQKLINLLNRTTPAQAFAIIQKVKFVLSEDSGLMHMAWVSGIPTLAFFGSTRSDWSRPLGEKSLL